MQVSSNLQGKTNQEIIAMAKNIASETFIKNSNKAISFTENNDLRIMVGGRYDSYKELSKIVIMAYTEMQADLIISNCKNG